jgi:hypothetical protein
MEEFIHKTISDSILLDRAKSGPVECKCLRTRTSKGFAAIELRIGGAVALSLSSDTYGAEYEQVAMQIADLLQRVAKNPCTLPAG